MNSANDFEIHQAIQLLEENGYRVFRSYSGFELVNHGDSPESAIQSLKDGLDDYIKLSQESHKTWDPTSPSKKDGKKYVARINVATEIVY